MRSCDAAPQIAPTTTDEAEKFSSPLLAAIWSVRFSPSDRRVFAHKWIGGLLRKSHFITARRLLPHQQTNTTSLLIPIKIPAIFSSF